MSLTQWAEVLSADAFSAFEDAGLDNEKVAFHQKNRLGSFLCMNQGQHLFRPICQWHKIIFRIPVL